MNHFHNILRLFNVLPNFLFTASETMRDYYLQTWYIIYKLQVGKGLKAYSSVASLRAKMEIPLILGKIPSETEIKLPGSAPRHTKTRATPKYPANDRGIEAAGRTLAPHNSLM